MVSQDISRTLLELLYHINRELVTTLDLHQVLARLLLLSVQNIGAERGSIVVLDEKLSPVDAAIVYGDRVQAHSTQQLLDIIDKGLVGWVIRNRQPAFVENTQKDERWLYHPDDSVERSGAKSAICVPIITREKLVGVLTIVHPVPGFFSLDRLELLQAIADQAGIGIYNAMLYESLQAMNRRYRELFEDSIDPIFITDMKGNILEVNRQAILAVRLDPEAILEKPIYDFILAVDEHFRDKIQSDQSGKLLPFETILMGGEGVSVPIEVYVREIDFEGEVNLQWILHDISERKALDKLRDDLGAMIYHDIRSPLSNIVTSLDMLEMMLPKESDPSLKSVLSIVDRSAERVQRLVSGLLDINRLESGQPITHMQIYAPVDLVNDALEAVTILADSKNQQVETSLDENLPEIKVDGDMLRRVLINLIENALKYSPSNGKVIVRVCSQDRFIRFSVDDSGPGIPIEARKVIFEKFTRLRAEQFPKGIGLGLAFCRLAVEAHGGSIWVEDAPGMGSSFAFTIPVQAVSDTDKD